MRTKAAPTELAEEQRRYLFDKQSASNPGGRPRVRVNLEELNRLRAQGMSWRRIGGTLNIGASTAFHLWRDGTTPRTPEKPVQKPRGDDSGG